MIQSSIFNWSYISCEICGKLARRARNRLAFVARVPLSLATFNENWVNPPSAPPTYNTRRDADPLKYGTPRKNKEVGDAEWDPI